MNTKQLIILWYCGIAAISVLFYASLHIYRRTPISAALMLVTAIVTIAALSYLSVSQLPSVRKRAAALAIVLPLLVIVGAYGLLRLASRHRVLPPSAVVVTDVEFYGLEYGCLSLVGHIENRSNFIVTEVRIETDVLGRRALTPVPIYIRPEEVGTLHKVVDCGYPHVPKPPDGFDVVSGGSYRYAIVGAVGKPRFAEALP